MGVFFALFASVCFAAAVLLVLDAGELITLPPRIRAVLAYGLVCLIAAGAVATLFMLLTARGS